MEAYLDNGATTRVLKEVNDKIYEILKDEYGNPSSIHGRGIRAYEILKEAREKIGRSLNVSGEEIIFNSCASEGNNQVLKAFRGKNIISDLGEHPSVINSLKSLEEDGTKVTYLKLDPLGRIDIEEFKGLINKETDLVSIMMVNNETGAINPIYEISQIIKENNYKAKLHVDLVQGYLKFPIDLKDLSCDFATISFHKVHGPKGIGALYIKKGLRLKPLIEGGGQENGQRAGTHNLPYIGGVSLLPGLLGGELDETLKRVLSYKLDMYNHLKGIKGFKLNGEIEGFSPYILNISIKGVPSQVILNLLSEEGVYVSTGSACSQKNKKDSHVLTAMGLNKDEVSSSLRLSFSDDTRKEEIELAKEAFTKALKFFKKI